MTADKGQAALDLARAGWCVLPCHGKIPLTPHGVRDATGDPERIRQNWARSPEANIGAAVPHSLFVVDLDPRNGGDVTLAELVRAHGPLPPTLTCVTGGGGSHYYFLRPLLECVSSLGPGLDVKVGGKGYVIVPPSVHPKTGRTYRWQDPSAKPAMPPPWLVELLRPPRRSPPQTRHPSATSGDRPGDALAAQVSWAELLEPQGWAFCGSRGQINYWRRPGKREGVSATTNATGTDHLHVFSSAAPPFEADGSYSKFGAFALLEHGGDFSAAAKALRKEVAR